MLNLSNLKWLYMYQKIGSKDMQKKYLEKIKETVKFDWMNLMSIEFNE